MVKKIIFYCFMLLTVFSKLYCQQEKMTAIQVLKKATQALEKQDYVSNNSKYILYLDYTSQKAYEQYNGIVLKKNNVNYFKIKNTEFVAFKDCGLKINHDEKAIVIENEAANDMQESPLSLDNYLKGFDSKLIVTNKHYFICELMPTKISQILLSKIVIYIRKTDFSIAKQTLFFIEKMEYKEANGKTVYTTPRLEISLSPRTKNEKIDSFLIAKENYFTVKNNKIILSKRLSAYQLFKS